MKKYLTCCLLTGAIIIAGINNLKAQIQGPSRLFRVYEDNDYLNLQGHGTDESYSNGIRFDQFYTKKHPSRFFIDKWMPAAGDSSINVFGWGLMQKMVTPSDISKTYDQPCDYAYAGVICHTYPVIL